MDDITTRPLSLDNLLDGIASGTTVLPDFQRDFDWESGDVVSLIATVLSAWPAGSLLLMRGRPDFFEVREFEFAPPRASTIDTVVLDGQQRLTALSTAFRGVGPTRYALDLKRLEGSGSAPYEIDSVEGALVTKPAGVWQDAYDLDRQARDELIPLYSLSSASNFFEWRDEILDRTPDIQRRSVGLRLTRVYKNLLGTANKYAFPAVILENDLPAQAVARIFERVNRTGHRLGTFDLLVARTYSRGWNLRDRWDAARREGNFLDQYLGEDGTPVLQAMSLRLLGDVRQPALLSLTQTQVQQAWDQSVSAFEQALGVVREWGVENPAWLPYKAILLPLAALAYDHLIKASDKNLRAWFWSRSFGQAYDVGSSTVAASDYKELLADQVHSDGILPSVLDVDVLKAATRKANGALWRSFVSYLNGLEPRDPLTGENLHDDMSAVAVSVLGRDAQGVRDVHLRILSQVISSKRTAKIARSGSLLDEAVAPGALTSQLLPQDSIQSGLRAEDFIEQRAGLVIDSLKRTCGSLLTFNAEVGSNPRLH